MSSSDKKSIEAFTPLVASDANDNVSANVDSTITDNDNSMELDNKDSTLSEDEEISPIAQTSPKHIRHRNTNH